MNFQKNLKGLIILYMFGFFVGNIYANLFAKDYVLATKILGEYSIDQYILMEIDVKRYMAYLIPLRLTPLAMLCGLSLTRLRKISIIIFLVWTGFLSGIIVAASIIKMGVIGTLFIITLMFPHMFFYFAAYYILFLNIGRFSQIKWNYAQILVVFIVMCIGILTECHVNPKLIKLFLKTV